MTTSIQSISRLIGLIMAIALHALPNMASATNYYVNATSGNDANNGLSHATAWETITHAAATVPSGTSAADPNVIYVSSGTYNIGNNHETFPINFTHDFVSLIGAGAATTFIDMQNLTVADALHVSAKGFSLSGFTFQRAQRAIGISEGGFSIANNVFQSTIGQGIYFFRNETGRTESISFADMSITGNTFNTFTEGIYVNVDLGFDNTANSLSASFGNLTISANNFLLTGGEGINIASLSPHHIRNGTVTIGNFTITGNTFEGGTTGLSSDSSMSYLTNCQVTIGNMTVTDNTFTNLDGYGMDFNWWGIDYLNQSDPGATDVNLGDLVISDNMASSTSYAIYLQRGSIHDIYYQSTVTTGPIKITGNTFNVENDGLNISFESVHTLGDPSRDDTVKVSLGGTTITGNTISANYYVTYLIHDSVAYDTYGHSSVATAPLFISDNTLTSQWDNALYIELVNIAQLHDNSSLAWGPITVNNNTLRTMDNYEAISFIISGLGAGSTDAPSLTMGDIGFGNNTIDASRGINVFVNNLASSETAKVTFGKLNIHDNTLSNISSWGIQVSYSNSNSNPATASLIIDAPEISGNILSSTSGQSNGIEIVINNATDGITFGTAGISANTVTGFEDGIFLGLDEAVLSCNYLENNALGIRFNTAGTFIVKNNSLVNNTVGLSVDGGMAANVTAENNWWGDKLGPVACASCNGIDPGDSGTVAFTPWLTSQPLKSNCGATFPWPLFLPAITGMGNR
jgi:hypothetical protein